MCFGDIARIESIEDEMADVLSLSGPHTVSLAVLLAEGRQVGPGDWILTSMGLALNLLDDDDVQAIAPDIAASWLADVFR